MRKEEALELRIARHSLAAECREPMRGVANILDTRDARTLYAPLRCLNQIGSQDIQHLFQRFVEFQLLASGRVRCMDLPIGFAKDRNFVTKRCDIQKLRLAGIIEIRSE